MSFWSKLRERLFGRTEPSVNEMINAVEKRAATPRVPEREREPGAEPPVARDTFGVTPADPILCDQPSGERAYIGSLRCSAGHPLAGPRLRSMPGKCTDPRHHVSLLPIPGENPAELCLVDEYELRCTGGEFACVLYFDMYHPGAPPQPAPAGMSRV